MKTGCWEELNPEKAQHHMQVWKLYCKKQNGHGRDVEEVWGWLEPAKRWEAEQTRDSKEKDS